MPFAYVIDLERGILFTRAWGRFTDDDVLEHQRRKKVDPDFDPGYRELVDLSQVEEFELTVDGILEIVANDNWGNKARRAFISPTDVIFGMARMYETLLDGAPQEVAVFRTVSEAWQWLGQHKEIPGSDSASA